jgi:hypothetical protein
MIWRTDRGGKNSRALRDAHMSGMWNFTWKPRMTIASIRIADALGSTRFLDFYRFPLDDPEYMFGSPSSTTVRLIASAFPDIRAITTTKYNKMGMPFRPFSMISAYLQSAYLVTSADDLYLWAILSKNGVDVDLTISTRLSSRYRSVDSRYTFAPMAFQPLNPVCVFRIDLLCAKISDTDAEAVAATFHTCLAITQFSRALWLSSIHETDTGLRRAMAGDMLRLSVKCESQDKGIYNCLQIVDE